MRHQPFPLTGPTDADPVDTLRAPSHLRAETLTRMWSPAPWRLALPHARDEHLLIWVTRGQGRALVNGVRRGLGAGNILWVPSGAQFALEIGPQVLGHVLRVHGSDAGTLPQSPQHLRIRDANLQAEMTGLIDMIVREGHSDRPLQDDALRAQFTLVEVWLRRMMVLVGAADDRVHLAIDPTATAARRLTERFALRAEIKFRTGAAMADYAAALDVTPTHLARVCKQVAGMSAADLLTARTLHEARRLLVDSDVPAKNIAKHLGFGSPAYFSRFILKHTGESPSRLRGTS